MADDVALSSRLDALERKVDRLLSLMEGGGAGGSALQVETNTRLAEIQAVEGDARIHQLGDALVEVSDPEVLGALVRIAQLAPQLEYAVQAVAAGPVLLEEGLESVRQAMGPHDDKLRIEAGMELLQAVGQTRNLQAATGVAAHGAALATGVQAAAEAMTELSEVHGAAVASTLKDTLLKLGDPEVIGTLGRLAELAPQLEYAAYAAAAGPELIEDTMTWLQELGGEDPVKMLIAARPKLEQAMALLDTLPDAASTVLDFLHELEEQGVVQAAQKAVMDAANAPPKHVGLWGLISALSDPDIQRTVGIGLTGAKAFSQRLKQLPVAQAK